MHYFKYPIQFTIRLRRDLMLNVILNAYVANLGQQFSNCMIKSSNVPYNIHFPVAV